LAVFSVATRDRQRGQSTKTLMGDIDQSGHADLRQGWVSSDGLVLKALAHCAF
jgi:hypothetical protein